MSGLQAPEILRQFDGINLLDSFSIKNSHATRNKNITSTMYPALTVRKEPSLLTRDTKASTEPTVLDDVTGVTYGANTMTNWDVQGMGVRRGEFHLVAEGIWYMKRWDEDWVVLFTGLDHAAKATFASFQGDQTNINIIMTNGANRPYRYDGTSVKLVANAPNAADLVCMHDNRLYMSTDSTVYYSALRKLEDWTTVNDSGQIVVETPDGYPIRGLVAGSTHLTIFKSTSIWELYGTNPSNFQLKLVTDSIGSPTGNSAQVIDGVTYFLGYDSVYRYSGGALPSDDFALPIRPIIKTINQDAIYSSVSWKIGKKYYLGIPTGTNTRCDTVLEYDIEFNTWNTWSMTYMPTAKGVVESGFTYVGCYAGRVYKFDGLGDASAIPYEWVSKPFTLGSMAATTRWYRMWVVADIPTGATLNVHVSTESEGENWTLVQSVSADTDIKTQEIRIPTTLISQANWVRIRLEGTGQVKVHEISRQSRIFPFGQG